VAAACFAKSSLRQAMITRSPASFCDVAGWDQKKSAQYPKKDVCFAIQKWGCLTLTIKNDWCFNVF